MSLRRAGRRIRFTLLWPALFVYFFPSRRARVLICHDDKVLLVRNRTNIFFNELSWALPGGGIRRAEDAQFGAARELREELGIDVEPAALQLLAERRTGGYGLSYRGFFFMLQLEAEPSLIVQAAELTEARWFILNKLSIGEALLERETRQGLALWADHQ